MPPDSRPILITTPIYYVNDRPHIGHAYTTIVADYLARAHRILGRETFFLTGTDEHGARIAEVAKTNGITPQELCDRNSALFRDAWKRLNIEYNYFVRTTDARHKSGVIRMLERLHKAVGPDGKPVVYRGEYTGLYCLGCEKFITEKELVDGLCTSHLTAPQKVSEHNYFFRLSAYRDRVEKLIEDGSIRILPEERRREVLGLFKQGIDDFSISREKVEWGIPLPFDPSQNAYVWVDALPNYITAVGYGDNPNEFAKWWSGAHVIHLMAKDILKFHAVYWPAMLLAIGEKSPQTIVIHGYFTVNGQKMSKSLQNAIDPHPLVDRFGPDGARYLLLTQFQFGQDGDVKADEFVRQYNADLANDLGNLVSRTVTMIERHFAGILPSVSIEPIQKSDIVLAVLKATPAAEFRECVERFDPSGAIAAVNLHVRRANALFDRWKPWDLAKRGATDQLALALRASVELIRVAAILLSPVIPAKSRQILKALGFQSPDSELNWDAVLETNRCPGPFHLDGPIFPRLEKTESARTERVAVSEPSAVPENVVTIDQFRQVELRTAEVVAAEKVAGADRLLKLHVALGGEQRQIVAGIAAHYKPEDLIGRTIIVVANLQPTKIRGVESHGMLLAASDGATLRLVTTDAPIPSGSSIS